MFSFYKDNMRWLAGGFLLAMFSGFGQTYFISIWGSEIRQAFELSHGGFGLVYMIATLASALTLPFVGRLVDVTSVAVSSTVVILMLALACVGMSLANSIVALALTVYLLRLFGQGMMTHIAMTAMGRWYVDNRGKAVSFATIGHNFSEAIAPACFVALAALFGWRQAWSLAAACLVLIALPVIVALMRVERIPRTNRGDQPEKNEIGRQWQRNEMLTDPLFWLTGTGVFAPAFIGTSIFFHQDYLIRINGWERWVYDASFAMMAGLTVCVALLTGLAVDRFRAVRVLPFFMMPLGFSCLVLSQFSGQQTIVAFMALLGLSYGMSSTLFGALWPEVYGTRHLGSLRAVTVSFMVFMSAAGPGVTGGLIDLGIPFQTQLLFLALYCFVSVVLMGTASRYYLQRRAAELAGASPAPAA